VSVLGIDALYYLSAVLFLPLVGAIVALLARGAAKAVAIITASLELALAGGLLYATLDAPQTLTTPAMTIVASHDWLPRFGLSYALQSDPLSVWLILLTAFLLLIAVIAPIYAHAHHGRANSSSPLQQPGSYYAGLLALTTGMLGVFMAHSMFLFYIFWEAMLVPAYFLIARFARQRGPQIAMRFIIYALGGGLVMLAGLIGLGAVVAAKDPQIGFNPDAWLPIFNSKLGMMTPPTGLYIDANTQTLLFAAIVIGVAVKIPLLPLHSWLPDTYAESPAPVTVMIAGVMSKTGVYVLLRFGVMLFPLGAANWQPWLAGLAIAGILYGALAALSANSLQRIAAYASLSHMGFITLGVVSGNADGQSGALLQMVNHGVIIAALFLVAAMLEQRAGSRNLTAFGGWGSKRPLFATMFMLISLATLGLPGLSSFAGEFLIMLGAWQAEPVYAALAVLGVILAAWYMARMYQQVMHGAELNHPAADMHGGEMALLLPLTLLFVVVGVAPGLITDSILQMLK
jgi:NADH-quinone oxidoreductase subunit M